MESSLPKRDVLGALVLTVWPQGVYGYAGKRRERVRIRAYRKPGGMYSQGVCEPSLNLCVDPRVEDSLARDSMQRGFNPVARALDIVDQVRCAPCRMLNVPKTRNPKCRCFFF